MGPPNQPTGAFHEATSRDGASLKILAVVVLYQTRPSESTTVKTLQAAAGLAVESQLRLKTVLFDNTPGGQDVTVPAGMHYQATPTNPGLAVAYNAALRAASVEGFDWLLTLDQDTELPPQFFNILLKYVSLYGKDSRVAAIVPHVVDNGRLISPFRFLGGFLPVMLDLKFSGKSKRFTSALNSASLLCVTALSEINGYDERFPLNNSDTSLFYRLGQAGKLVVVAGELIVLHELAILNRTERMATDRYRKLLADERALWDLHMGVLGRMERLLRLIGRASKDRILGQHKAFHTITIQEIRYRLLTRRRKRMEAWVQSKQYP